MRRAGGIMVAVATAALLAPASAHAALGWHDANPDHAIPATVKLNDVATYGPDLVVAVGRETVTETDGTTVDRPAIYRFWRGVWTHDTIVDGTGAQVSGAGELVDVAVNAGGLWAVGTQGAAPGAPLLVNLATSPTQVPDTPRSWTALAAPAGETPMGLPRAIALGGTGGLIGDATGRLWQIAGTAFQPVTWTNQAAAVNGVAFTNAGGIAATAATSTDPRIFDVNTAAAFASPAPAVPSADTPALVGIAGRAGVAVAIDSGAYWQPNSQGVWQRKTAGLTTAGLQLVDVSLGDTVSAMAGNVTTATGTQGYVLRGSVGNWRNEPVSGAAINGVAAYRPDAIWAVGDGGTVFRYWDKPADPIVCVTGCDGGGTSPGPGEGSGGGGTGGGGTTYDYGPTTTTSGNNQTTVIPPERKGDPTVVITEPKQPAAKRKPRRLLDRVKVLRRAKRLIITFRLRARARVAIAAKRGRRVVSRSRSRAMRPGRRRVVLPFKGSPPNQLRIVVRPLRAKRAR